MQKRFTSIVASCAVALICVTTTAAAAQTPAPDRIVVASPTYTFIPMEIDVDRPAAEVWQRIGGYCDIGEWFGIACTITSGTEDEFGAVRSVANEVLGKDRAFLYLHPDPRRGPAVQPLSRNPRGAAGHGEHVEAWSIPYSTTTRRWRTTLPGKRTGPKARIVHEGTREHEDSRRGRHAATSVGLVSRVGLEPTTYGLKVR